MAAACIVRIAKILLNWWYLEVLGSQNLSLIPVQLEWSGAEHGAAGSYLLQVLIPKLTCAE